MVEPSDKSRENEALARLTELLPVGSGFYRAGAMVLALASEYGWAVARLAEICQANGLALVRRAKDGHPYYALCKLRQDEGAPRTEEPEFRKWRLTDPPPEDLEKQRELAIIHARLRLDPYWEAPEYYQAYVAEWKRLGEPEPLSAAYDCDRDEFLPAGEWELALGAAEGSGGLGISDWPFAPLGGAAAAQKQATAGVGESAPKADLATRLEKIKRDLEAARVTIARTGAVLAWVQYRREKRIQELNALASQGESVQEE